MNIFDGFPIHLRVLPQEMHGDLGNIFYALLERRSIDLHDVDAVIEIQAEFSLSHQLAPGLRESRKLDEHAKE